MKRFAKNSKNRKQKKSPYRGLEAFSTAGFLKIDKIVDYVLIGLALLYFIFYFWKLFSSLGNTHFWADENVHAFISSAVLKTKGIPAVFISSVAQQGLDKLKDVLWETMNVEQE